MEVNSNDEIDIVFLLKKLYKSRKLILFIAIIFSSIGIALALLLPEKYNSTTVFITQNQETGSSSLSGVASLVGINLGGSSGNEIPPSMYPQIIQSAKFKRLILEKEINEKKNVKLLDFIIDYYSIQDDNEQSISELGMTRKEKECFDVLSKIISVGVNQKDGFITITTQMPVAEYSAKVAKYSREILQKIIIDNKIESARQNLIFSESQLLAKKQEFDEIYSKLAFYSDTNLNSVNSFVINEKNKLESEFKIISAVVEEISKQVEQSKLQLNKDTPVFSTIQEAIIPVRKSSPKRAQIVIAFGLIGFIFSSIYIVLKEPINDVLLEIKKY